MARRTRVGPGRLAATLVLGAAATALLVSARGSTDPDAGFALRRAFGPPPTVTSAARPTLPALVKVVAPSSAPRPLLPGQPRKLTDGGCCAGAWWSEDGWQLRFIDRPPDAPAAAIYGVQAWPPESPVVALPGAELAKAIRDPVIVRPGRGYAMIEDVATGDRWPLPTDGRPVRVSPDGAWAVSWDAPPERVLQDTFVRFYGSDIYGFDERELGGYYGAEVVDFLPEGNRVLVAGRPARGDATRILVVVDVETGETTELARGAWLGYALRSPDGEWVVYAVSLDRARPEANGVWAVPTDGGEPRKLAFEGSYRWRDGHRLVYMPLEPGARQHALWQMDVATGDTKQVLGTDVPYLRVANNDWSVSPDGESIAFRSEVDRNLWVIDLPD